MKQFLILYTGMAPKLTQLPADQATAELDSWNQWGLSLGNALISNGMPVVDQAELVDNGERSRPIRIQGYAIIQAETLDQALELVKSHPHLVGKEGKCGIAAYELMTEPLTSYAQNQTMPNPAPTEATAAVPSASPPQAGATLPPPIEETAVPPPVPGELTIPHEQTAEEDPPVQPPQELPPPTIT
jgi:hypothetical protein